MSIILEKILAHRDLGYRDFHKRLIPTVEESCILGLRSPDAMKIAKEFAFSSEGTEFLKSLPHRYYDENIVHAFMLGRLKCPHGELLVKLKEFLPYVDNWAVCDGLCSHLKLFFKDLEASYPFVLECLQSSSVYTVRFGLVSLLNYYINEKYIEDILKIAVSTVSEEYYINMANAWLVSFCLIKEYEKTVPILEKQLLSTWTHNKSIQKALESYRIDRCRKNYLRGLKIK